MAKNRGLSRGGAVTALDSRGFKAMEEEHMKMLKRGRRVLPGDVRMTHDSQGERVMVKRHRAYETSVPLYPGWQPVQLGNPSVNDRFVEQQERFARVVAQQFGEQVGYFPAFSRSGKWVDNKQKSCIQCWLPFL